MKEKERWQTNLPSELDFWRDWIATHGSIWQEEYKERLNKSTPFRQDIEEEIVRQDKDVITVLDIGCGPATAIGYITKSKKTVVATYCDPLAQYYIAMWKEAGIEPPHPIIEAEAEELETHFHDKFDITFARNCLDHSHNPFRCIQQMLKITETGGLAILFHGNCEGSNVRGFGLHQWDFYINEEKFFLKHIDGEPINIGETMNGIAKIESLSANEYNQNKCVFRKL